MPTTTTKQLTISRTSLAAITPTELSPEPELTVKGVELSKFPELAKILTPDHPSYRQFNDYWDQTADLCHEEIEENTSPPAEDILADLHKCYTQCRPGSAAKERVYFHLKEVLIRFLKETETHGELIRKLPNLFYELELWKLQADRMAELWVKEYQENKSDNGGETPSYSDLWKSKGNDLRGRYQKEALRKAIDAAIVSGDLTLVD